LATTKTSAQRAAIADNDGLTGLVVPLFPKPQITPIRPWPPQSGLPGWFSTQRRLLQSGEKILLAGRFPPAGYGFRAFDLAACRLLLKEIAVLVRSQVKPKVIFWRCVDVLVREKIEVPS
jgi:hypothetical protein